MTGTPRGDLRVTEVCFEVGCSSLGTFSTRFTELVGRGDAAVRGEAGHQTDQESRSRGTEPRLA